jgi:hypothetical protein
MSRGFRSSSRMNADDDLHGKPFIVLYECYSLCIEIFSQQQIANEAKRGRFSFSFFIFFGLLSFVVESSFFDKISTYIMFKSFSYLFVG